MSYLWPAVDVTILDPLVHPAAIKEYCRLKRIQMEFTDLSVNGNFETEINFNILSLITHYVSD